MAATTTAEENKALIRRNFKEAINDKNTTLAPLATGYDSPLSTED